MFIIFIYNNASRRLERYCLEAYDNMPYTKKNSMCVSDFLSGSSSYIGWSSSEFLTAWDSMSCGKIHPCHVFRRIYEGGHIWHSMHYAGVAADFKSLKNNNPFPNFENHGHCFHVSTRVGKFPEISVGDIGLFVLILQDSLNILGFTGGELDGFFGFRTRDALGRFQMSHNLPITYIADSTTWESLAYLACGKGITPTTSHIRHDRHFSNI